MESTEAAGIDDDDIQRNINIIRRVAFASGPKNPKKFQDAYKLLQTRYSLIKSRSAYQTTTYVTLHREFMICLSPPIFCFACIEMSKLLSVCIHMHLYHICVMHCII